MVQQKLIEKIKFHTNIPIWLFFVLIATIVLRIPSFFEPYYYGDEMIYLAIGNALQDGVSLYKEIFDHKTPLIYIFAQISETLFWFKALLTFWHLFTVILFWKLTIKLYPKEKLFQKVATIIFATLTTLPFWEGLTVNAELLMMGPVILGFILLFSEHVTPKLLITAGIAFSIATLFKVPALFEFPVIFIVWASLFKNIKKDTKTFIINSLYLVAGFMIPIILSIIWYWSQDALADYLKNALLFNVWYIAAFSEQSSSDSSLLQNSPLFMRGIILLGTLLITFLLRKKLSKQLLFICVWLFFTIFAITLPERPYPHYLIQAAAPLSLLLGILVSYKNSIEQSLTIIPITLFLFVTVHFGFWEYTTAPYYSRFVKLINNSITYENYVASFGDNVPRAYNTVQYINNNTHPDDTIYVWGDTASVYALAQKHPPIEYVTDFHINDAITHDELVSRLSKNPPELVIIFPNSNPPSPLLSFAKKNYVRIQMEDEVIIWKLLDKSK